MKPTRYRKPSTLLAHGYGRTPLNPGIKPLSSNFKPTQPIKSTGLTAPGVKDSGRAGDREYQPSNILYKYDATPEVKEVQAAPVSSYEDIGAGLIQSDYDTTAATAKDLGAGDTFTSLDEYFQSLIDAQNENKALQETVLNNQAQQNIEQGNSARNVLEGQMDLGSFLAGSREGATSYSNSATYDRLKKATGEQVTRLQRDQGVYNAQISQAKKDLARAQKEGNTELAQKYKETLAAAEAQAKQIDTDYINALTNQLSAENDYAKTQSAITQSGIQTFQGLVEAGTEMDYNTVQGYASQLGLPTDLLMGYYQGAQAIRDDKTLDTQTKAVQLAQLSQDLSDQVNGLRTTEAKNIDYLNQLRQMGASEEIISAFKSAAGITDYNDPITVAELNYQNAQTAYAESQTAENYQNLLAAQAEYDALYGTPSYLPTNGAYEITQTADGIQIGVRDGQSLDLPGTSRREDWCGAFVNDALGTEFGDLYTQKVGMINSTTPAPGMAFVEDTSDQYGHVGIVESVNWDTKMMSVVEANWQKGSDGKGIISRRTIPITDAVGFVKPEQSAPTSGNKYSYDSYLAEAQSIGLTGEDATAWAKDMATQAYTGFKNTDQSKSYYQYVKMLPEEEAYDAAVAKLSDDELEAYAEKNGYLAKKLLSYDPDTQLTAQIINELVDDPTQRQLILNQARWVGAKLRGESGAAISVGEYLTEGQQFWPQKGDDAKAIKDKENARKNVTGGLYDIMGPYGQRLIDESQADTSYVDPDEEEYNSVAIYNDPDFQEASSYYGTTTVSPNRSFSMGLGSLSPLNR